MPGVRTQHAQYIAMAPRWKRARDTADGQDAMRASCFAAVVKSTGTAFNPDAYIPPLKDQPADSYKAYVCGASWYGATWRTIAGLNGMLFRKPAVVDVPSSIEEYMKDVTGSGQPLHSFVENVGQEAITVGRVGVLTDYPTTAQNYDEAGKPVQLTLADAQTMRLRPTLSMYKAETITNWRESVENGVKTLSMLTLVERAVIPADEFSDKYETRYRVLDLIGGKYRVRMFRIDAFDKDEQIGSDVYPEINSNPLDYIPFVCISTDDLTQDVDTPPLIDLMDMNISHWRVSADYEHGCHFSALPTAFVTGYTPAKEGEKFYLGSSSLLMFSNKETRLGFLEFSGAGLGEVAKNMQEKERRMAVLGARMLEPQIRGVESAEAASIHRTGEQSMLSACATTISLGITKSLQWFSEWVGADGEVKYELSTNFYALPLDPSTLSALLQSYQQGAMSIETLLWNIKRREMMPDERTIEDEQNLIDQGKAKSTDGAAAVPIPDEPQKKQKRSFTIVSGDKSTQVTEN